MNLKGFLVGLVGATALLGPQLSFAYDPNALQRGWVDLIDAHTYPGPVVGPTYTIGFKGWACVRPGLSNYGVPPTNVAVYYGAPPKQGGIRVPLLEIRQEVTRYDVLNAGACASANVGFSVWIARPVNASTYYYVVYNGPYEETLLEGQSYF
jgi:hypothetical protein